MDWFAKKYTNEEALQWVRLRVIEWPSYPNFLAPLWGILVVYYYGWITFIISLIVVTFFWKLFIAYKYASIRLMDVMGLFVNLLKWPLAIVFAIISYEARHNIVFTLSLLIFPFVTYLCSFLEIPYKTGGLSIIAKQHDKVAKLIFNKVGIEYGDSTSD